MMGIRLLYISTRKNTDAIMQEAIRKLGDSVEFSLHLGSDDSDIKATSMTRMNMRKAKGKQHIMANKGFKGYLSAIANQAEFEKNAALFIDHLYRLDDQFRYKSHHLSTVYDYLDYYHILYDVIATKIIENDITHILFPNVPHLGFDTICYQIARSLGLRTVIITQSIFPDMFFSMNTVEAYGILNAKRVESTPVTIEKEEKLDHFYMKGISQGEGEGKKGRISGKAIMNLIIYLVRKKPSYLLSPLKVYSLIQRTVELYGSLPEWRDPFARFFHEDQFAYFEHIIQYEEVQFDLNERYIYFPLHMQPEMTTASLGDAFRDQASAIEALACMIPDEVKIYVKENPKQGAYMRGPLFFHRLKRIPNVVILPSHADTHALTEYAECIATITGTVGWEALRIGKKVITFGRAWYHSFPGVFFYHQDLSYDEVFSYRLEHSMVEEALGELVSRSHRGVVDKAYDQIVEGPDKKQNIERCSDVIVDLLTESITPTFAG